MTFHLIHANISIARAPLDDPLMAGFLVLAEEIDAIAHATPGFVAQPTPTDEGTVFTGKTLLNLSIWESVESLYRFTYGGEHALALTQRAEWFEQYDAPNYVLYWAPVGIMPTEAEVKRRIDYLAANGATPYAFTFEQQFTVQEMQRYELKRE